MIWEDLICNSKIEEYLQTRKKLQFENPGSDYSPEYVCTAPEQWQVIDWLLKTYNLWIRVDHFVSNDGMVTWDYEIDKTGVGVHDPSYQRLVEFQEDRGFATPQEAYSEAITYILENLI